jgi:hypothetical protein
MRGEEMKITKRVFIAGLVCTGFAARAEDAPLEGTLYKSPDCTCCEGHAAYLKRNGIRVNVIEAKDISAIKKQYGVPPELEGCHTILLGGYVSEGHMPIRSIRKLLRERPQIKGISLPGMPTGAPGMYGPKEKPFVIYEIADGEKKVFSTE